MHLTELAKFLACDEFRPMDERDWECFGGANPGTYICLDEEKGRVIFVEPTGDVGILYTGEYPFDQDGGEINFHLEFVQLEGFTEEAVKAREDYELMCYESTMPRRGE